MNAHWQPPPQPALAAASTAAHSGIVIDKVRKIYAARKNSAEVVALDDISLNVPKGTILGVIGRSGAGKSTLIRLINGLDKPSEGRVVVNGVDITALDEAALRQARRSIGMVFQHFNLLSSRTAFDNVALPLEIAGTPKAEIEKRVLPLLDMVGLADNAAAPVLGLVGRSILASRRWYDTEALAVDGGTAYIGLERVHQILKYDFGRDGVLARGEVLAVPSALRRLPSNKGVEALVAIPKGARLGGTLLAISERGLDANGNIIGFMLGAQTGSFAIRRSDDYDISDAALLPDGDLLLLERKFSLFRGAGIRIRRLPLNKLGPGALLDGDEIFSADLGYEIDNLEGIAVHRDAEGHTILTLVSDDNFSMIQRNLLLQFALIED